MMSRIGEALRANVLFNGWFRLLAEQLKSMAKDFVPLHFESRALLNINLFKPLKGLIII
jgi:hypothetical protein